MFDSLLCNSRSTLRRALQPILRRSGWLARRIRHRNPWAEPWRKKELFVHRAAALGDVLMCTPSLREVKRRNPTCRIIFFTDFTDLLAGLPFIDEVSASKEAPPGTIYFSYEQYIPPGTHIAQLFGDCVGVCLSDIHPRCSVDDLAVATWANRLSAFPRPWVLVNRKASTWTPNKDWPDEMWEDLIEKAVPGGTLIEIGPHYDESRPSRHRSMVDVRGQTSQGDMIALISLMDAHIGPVSGPVHIAAAFGVPGVVIYGGYEHPCCSAYPENINLYTPLSCSPCWLRTPCPYDRKCLRTIGVDRVVSALERLLARPMRLATPNRK